MMTCKSGASGFGIVFRVTSQATICSMLMWTLRRTGRAADDLEAFSQLAWKGIITIIKSAKGNGSVLQCKRENLITFGLVPGKDDVSGRPASVGDFNGPSSASAHPEASSQQNH